MNYRTIMIFSAGLAVLPASVQAAERRYSISDFEQVQVVGPHNVIVRTGRATSVVSTGVMEALDAISVESAGGVLKVLSVTKSRGSWKESSHPAVTVTVTLPVLKALRLLGSGSINAAEMRGIATSVILNGSGRISVSALTSDNLTTRLTGSGQIKLAGAVKNFDGSFNGSGDLDASSLTANSVKLVSSTSGRVAIRGTRTADVKQNGAGEVIVTGGPSCLVDNRGSGTASCGD